MNTVLRWIGLVAVVFLASASLFAQSSPSIRISDEAVVIPRINDVAIDGNAQDWGDEGFRIEVLADEWGAVLPRKDYNPQIRLGWDQRGLLVLATVDDDVQVACPSETVDFFSMRLGAAYDLIQIIMAPKPFADQYCAFGIAPSKTGGTLPATQLFDRSQRGKLENLRSEVAQKLLANGYQFESLLPWSNLGISPQTGQEFLLQIAASDFDGGNEKFRASWVADNQPVDHPTASRTIRLGEKPSLPEEILARASNRPDGLPWAHFVATPNHAGASASVQVNGRTIGESTLREENGWAATHVLLPKTPGRQSYQDLHLQVNKKTIATDSVDALAAAGRLSLRTVNSPDSPEKIEVTVSLADDLEDDASQEKVHIQAITPSELVVHESDAVLQIPFRLELPEGLYTVVASVDSYGGWPLEGETAVIFGDQTKITNDLLDQAEKTKSDPKMQAYAGWFDYLAEQVQSPYPPMPHNRSTERLMQMAQWLEKAKHEPKAYEQVRGVFEWAYLSNVDKNGQPFQLSIPDNYDSTRSWPLDVWMHGGGGLHFDTPEDWTNSYKSDSIGLRVLGRGREGGYRDLSEVDVLDAIEFVKSHWNIDPRRVHLGGGSMGGYGTFNLASRHPDRFASGRFHAGNGLEGPICNMLHVPIYGLHDRLDRTAAIEMARAPLAKLERFGGKAILEESEAFGHRVGDNKSGVARSRAWALRQQIPESVARIHYEATDGLARGAYWVKVHEWGAEARPATIDARVGESNELYLFLDNVQTAEINLAHSPVDLNAPMLLAVNRTDIHELAAPLPDVIYAIRQGENWLIQEDAPAAPDGRLHFPDGAKALYHGEPILIVWGTQGDDDADQALYQIGQVARQSTSPAWPSDEKMREGIPADYSLFGKLPGKADVDVTAEDMENYNLVLLGTVEQNAVVSQITEGMPVHIEGTTVASSDGQRWDFTQRALGLLYYNPLAPQRLIYWIAADRLEFYKPGASLLEWQRWLIAPPDFLLMNDKGPELTAARRFDSRWNWQAGYANSPLVSEAFCTTEGNAEITADMMRRAVDADFAVIQIGANATDRAFSPQATQVMDVVAQSDWDLICTAEMSGEELRAVARGIEQTQDDETSSETLFLFPQVPQLQLDPSRNYRVAIMSSIIFSYMHQIKRRLMEFKQTDISLRQAYERNWPLMVQAEQ